ncbi:MAG: small subunit ribosomal protein [Candidatus Parcubacteria bacterium]|jgi:ribosomal protein S6|nr:small subunit ribosomal protein [Candidatus Parcubacteria bacterium]
MEDNHDDRQTVYEIGYLILSTVKEDEAPHEADKLKKIIADSGAVIIAEEIPHKERLAYIMRRKSVAGSYKNYDEAYFGWVKFELSPSKVEAVKKTVEGLPSILRMILVMTLRENTYLGKRAPALTVKPLPSLDEKAPPPSAASIEEMDKSIDEMVKAV